MNAHRILAIRDSAPYPGLEFDTWFLPLVLEALEPMQADILRWLIRQDGESRSDTLTAHFETTPQRIGSAVSDLRKLGLVKTTPILGESARASRHCVVSWVMEASRETIL